MLYNTLKIIHIISATALLATMVYCITQWFEIKKQNHAAPIAVIQTKTWALIMPFAFLQLLSGFTMISLKQYGMQQLWVGISALGFVIMILTWMGFMYSLMLTATSQHNVCKHRRIQTVLLILCALTLLTMIFAMTNQIQ